MQLTVHIDDETASLLLKESRKREGRKGAVPSRTARQLIEERLEELNERT